MMHPDFNKLPWRKVPGKENVYTVDEESFGAFLRSTYDEDEMEFFQEALDACKAALKKEKGEESV